MPGAVAYVLFVAACVGHAACWVPPLNHLYGRHIHKKVLKPLRLLTGLVIVTGPVALLAAGGPDPADAVRAAFAGELGLLTQLYLGLCLVMGLAVFPAITVA